MAKRKTAAEREQEEFMAELREEQSFKRGVRALSNFNEAWEFANSAEPRSGLPGGRLYTNLGYYLHNHGESPNGARQWEKELHAELGEKLWPTAKKSPTQ